MTLRWAQARRGGDPVIHVVDLRTGRTTTAAEAVGIIGLREFTAEERNGLPVRVPAEPVRH
jgi:hypothetical protein